MSAPKSTGRLEGQEWFEELKTNRKTQLGLVGFGLALGFMAYMLWPEAPKRKPVRALATSVSASDDRSLQALDKLPDLAKLGQAGELPKEDRMYRDLFLFEGPPPKPEPPAPPPKPLPPPTAEELQARAIQQAKDAEFASRPQGLRYLGFLERKSVGRIATFVKADIPVSVRLNDVMGGNWKLVTVTPTYVEFQNLKYPEQRHRIDAVDATGAPRGAGATNEF